MVSMLPSRRTSTDLVIRLARLAGRLGAVLQRAEVPYRVERRCMLCRDLIETRAVADRPGRETVPGLCQRPDCRERFLSLDSDLIVEACASVVVP